jgi:hypothetical protein
MRRRAVFLRAGVDSVIAGNTAIAPRSADRFIAEKQLRGPLLRRQCFQRGGMLTAAAQAQLPVAYQRAR